MKPISGWTFLLSGLVIVIFSGYIMRKTNSLKLIIFFLIGIGFIIVGIAKLFKKRDKKLHQAHHHAQHRPHAQTHPHRQPTHQTLGHNHPTAQQHAGHQSHPHQNAPHAHKSHPHCPHCGVAVTHNGNYCISCGNKIR